MAIMSQLAENSQLTFKIFSLLSLLILAFCVLLPLWKRLTRRERYTSVIVFCLAFFALFPSFRHAANLTIVPDSGEYAVGAYRLFTQGYYNLEIDDKPLPPRYPFGFSLFVVLPGIAMSPHHFAGAGVLGVALLSALGISCAFLIGGRLHSELAGVYAAAILLIVPGYAGASQEIISNAPAAALWLLAMALYITEKSESENWSSALALGICILFAFACRPLSLLIVPALCVFSGWGKSRSYVRYLWVLPSLGLAAGYLVYNWRVFGYPLRSGYSFWCSVPYDYTNLLFSLSYIPDNLRALAKTGIAFLLPLAIIGYFIGRRGARPSSRHAVLFAVLTGLPLIVFHLLYFFVSSLFFLQSLTLFVPFAAIGVICICEKISRSPNLRFGWLTLAIVAVAVKMVLAFEVHSKTERIDYVESISQSISPNAIFVSALDPVFLAHNFDPNHGIKIIPISRHVEYASKILTPEKMPILVPPPKSAFDHRAEALVSKGGIEAVQTTALEEIEALRKDIELNHRVFLDTRFTTSEEQQKLADKYRMVPVAPGLSQIKLQL